MNKNSSLIWWIPIFLLLVILYPLNIRLFDIYVTMAIPFVGVFSAWLALGYLFFFRAQKNATHWGIIFAVITLLYNPIVSKYSLVNILSAISHWLGILLNVVVACIFLYNWWAFKHQNKKDLG
jgi:Na+/proline symporter